MWNTGTSKNYLRRTISSFESTGNHGIVNNPKKNQILMIWLNIEMPIAPDNHQQ